MERTSAELSYDFLFPKLHGMWAASMKGEALDRLVHSAGIEAMARQLSGLQVDLSRRDLFQKTLTASHIEELVSVKWLLDRRTGGFYEALIGRYFYENLKTVLHYFLSSARDVPMAALLIDATGLPPFDAGSLLEARNVHQLFSRLPQAARRDDVLRLLVEAEDSRDLLWAECRLDQMFYADLVTAVGRLPLSTRACARRLVSTEIDFSNLIMILRNAAIYHLPPERVLDLCLADGRRLDRLLLEKLVAATEAQVLLALLPPEYRGVLSPFVDAELYLAENALWNAHFGQARERFADFNRPAHSIVAFPFLKRYEMLNVSRVFEGLHFGLDVRLIQGMMIGGEDV